MDSEGELLTSTIPVAEDVPLSTLAVDDGLERGFGDDTDVPVAEFQSSV